MDRNPSHLTPPSAAALIKLRHAILEALQRKPFVSAACLERSALYLNLCTHAPRLEALLPAIQAAQSEREIEHLLFREAITPPEVEGPSALALHPEPAPEPTALPAEPPLRLASFSAQNLQHRLQQAWQLVHEGCVLSSLLTPQRILQRAAQAACRLMASDLSLVIPSIEDEQAPLGVCGPTGEPPRPQAPLLTRPAETGLPVVVENTQRVALPGPWFSPPFPARSLLSVPLGPRGGVIIVGWQRAVPITPGDVDLLSALARQITFALENLHLHEQARALERLRERQRITQDLHDTVIQLLFVMGMEAGDLAQRLTPGCAEQQQALRIQHMASRAATELRAAIAALSLKPSGQGPSLAELLREAAEEVEHLSPIQITIVEPPHWPALPPSSSRAVYRIVREALLNAQKHAQATDVVLSITTRPDKLIISVQDNGKGFPPDLNPLDPGNLHFGLRSMHRLAEQVGGYLEALNGEEGGAMIRLILPLDA